MKADKVRTDLGISRVDFAHDILILVEQGLVTAIGGEIRLTELGRHRGILFCRADELKKAGPN